MTNENKDKRDFLQYHLDIDGEIHEAAARRDALCKPVDWSLYPLPQKPMSLQIKKIYREHA